jgi:cob(I)alamin adenosyltransferase
LRPVRFANSLAAALSGPVDCTVNSIDYGATIYANATLPEDVHPKQPRVTDVEIRRLEAEMDRMNEDLSPLRSFVLPGGSRIDAELHVARTVCRRAERECVALGRLESVACQVPPEAVRYLNRLSDAFFVWSRWAGHIAGAPETLWEPNQSASGTNREGAE